MEQMVLDAYRADLVEAKLIEFLRDHDNRLPMDELDWCNFLRSQSEHDPAYFSCDAVRQQFRIDFRFPLGQVDWDRDWEHQRDQFSILQPNPGRTSRWQGPDLNERIYRYLQSTIVLGERPDASGDPPRQN